MLPGDAEGASAGPRSHRAAAGDAKILVNTKQDGVFPGQGLCWKDKGLMSRSVTIPDQKAARSQAAILTLGIFS